ITSSISSSLITLLTSFPCSASPSCIAIPSLIICAHSAHAASLAVCAINCWPTSAWLHTSCTPTARCSQEAAAFLTACWRASSTFAVWYPPHIPFAFHSRYHSACLFLSFPLSCPIILLLPNSCSQSCCLVLASVPLVRLSVANGALYFFVAVSPVLL
ncbi:hypothetical protein BDZ91DRAFT_740645, partial [Kalaharituber pfeilii]